MRPRSELVHSLEARAIRLLLSCGLLHLTACASSRPTNDSSFMQPDDSKALSAGKRVRVTLDGPLSPEQRSKRLEGTVVSVDRQTLHLVPERSALGARLSIPLFRIEKVEVRAPGGTYLPMGLMVGAMGGAVVGVVAANRAVSSASPGIGQAVQASVSPAVVVMFTLMGMGIGTLVGAGIPRETWQTTDWYNQFVLEALPGLPPATG